MTSWLRGLVLALIFGVIGAFVASLWIEMKPEAPRPLQKTSGLWEGRRIRVEVLNGAGVDRLARTATERLRSWGFDVVYYGNAEGLDRDSSVVVARLQDVEPARRVADALGLQTVSHEPDENLYLDVTVILGADWQIDSEGIGDEDTTGLQTWWGRLKRLAGRLSGG